MGISGKRNLIFYKYVLPVIDSGFGGAIESGRSGAGDRNRAQTDESSGGGLKG
ncbi:hypothetical protein [Microcoleus sp. CAWBG58]|uniref:hypothetical protein n=1 Tax=Microcoleus sp. CAWBG58 TaxID=2841651 RepID=UPI0025D388C8|nr:hypothetical protein [Microcoleus sp. CAWBG58]